MASRKEGIIYVLFAVLIIGKILAFLREVVFAKFFGTSAEADIYLLALVVPATVSTIFQTVCKQSILPLFSEKYVANQESSGWRVFNFALLVSLGISLLACGLLYVAWKPTLILLGLESRIGTLLTARSLLFILTPIIALNTIIGLLSGVANARNEYFFASLTPIALNVVAISSIVFFSKSIGIYSVAWGLLGGYLLQALMLLMVYRPTEAIDAQGRRFGLESSTFVKLAWPLAISTIIFQVDSLVDRMVASRLEVGGVAALQYGVIIGGLPANVLSNLFITTLFPALSKQWVLRKVSAYAKLLTASLYRTILLVIPILCLLLFKTSLIVSVAFERGNFTAESTSITSAVLRGLLLWMMAYALWAIVQTALVSIERTTALVQLSVVNVVLHAVLALSLGYYFGIVGVAIASSISMTVILIGGAYSIRKFLGVFIPPDSYELLRHMLVAFGVLFLVLGIETFFEWRFVSDAHHHYLRDLTEIGLALAAYTFVVLKFGLHTSVLRFEKSEIIH